MRGQLACQAKTVARNWAFNPWCLTIRSSGPSRGSGSVLFCLAAARPLSSSVMPHMALVPRLIFLSSIALPLLSQAADPRVTGMYSNLRFGTEDVTGVEMYVVSSHGSYYASLQCAEGAPGIPETVKLSISGSSVSFVVPSSTRSGCPSGATFTGQLAADGIRGSFAGTDWPGFLKRSNGYWQ